MTPGTERASIPDQIPACRGDNCRDQQGTRESPHLVHGLVDAEAAPAANRTGGVREEG